MPEIQQIYQNTSNYNNAEWVSEWIYLADVPSVSFIVSCTKNCSFGIRWAVDGNNEVIATDTETLLAYEVKNILVDIKARFGQFYVNTFQSLPCDLTTQALYYTSSPLQGEGGGGDITLSSVGSGANIIKNGIGPNITIKSLESSDNSITISELTNEINLVAPSNGLPSSLTLIDTQEFTTPGTFNWNKPVGATYVSAIIIGSGGGGGSGRKGLQTGSIMGGQCGSPGNITYVLNFPASYLPNATYSVVVASGGNGGNSQTTNSTNGSAGSAGSASSVFGFSASGGAGGQAGTNSSTFNAKTCSIITNRDYSVFYNLPSIIPCMAGVTTSLTSTQTLTTPGPSYANVFCCTPGSAGSSYTSSTNRPPVAGVGYTYFSTVVAGTPAPAVGDSDGVNGSITNTYFGLGGSGGWNLTNTAPRKGGDGIRGSGGGGGSHGVDTIMTGSGAGGRGGDGYVIIFSYQ